MTPETKKSAKILVVDDDPDMREAIRMILEPAGFQVAMAKDGEEGLSKLEAEKPALMFLDLLMPRKDGFAVLKEIQEAEKWRACDSMPIVVMSSVREEPARKRYYLETAMDLGVDDYIEKPIAPGALVARAKSALAMTATARQKAKAEQEKKGKKKAKVLLVDDDKDFVEATKMILTKQYDVIVAYNGDEGLKKAKQENPDLIILDVIMPVKDGFATCEQLKQDPWLVKIPVLMLTSFAQRMGETTLSQAQALTLEAEDFVDKPVPPQELLLRVGKLLKKVGKA